MNKVIITINANVPNDDNKPKNIYSYLSPVRIKRQDKQYATHLLILPLLVYLDELTTHTNTSSYIIVMN